jgi:hypothetical protein
LTDQQTAGQFANSIPRGAKEHRTLTADEL